MSPITPKTDAFPYLEAVMAEPCHRRKGTRAPDLGRSTCSDEEQPGESSITRNDHNLRLMMAEGSDT